MRLKKKNAQPMEVLVARPLWMVILELRECILRWQAMQRSTQVYVENCIHDLRTRDDFSGLASCLQDQGTRLRAGKIESSEEMFRALRKAVDVMEKALNDMEKVGEKEELLKGLTFYHGVVREWQVDVVRMMSAELAHKRLCLAAASVESMSRWMEEPLIDKPRWEEILRLTTKE